MNTSVVPAATDIAPWFMAGILIRAIEKICNTTSSTWRPLYATAAAVHHMRPLPETI